MKFDCKFRSTLALILIAGSLSSCSLDPHVRKQNDFANGKLYLQKGNYRAAAIEFANAIRIDPNFVDAHLQLANTYLKMQQPDRAYQEFADVVQLKPDDYQARIAMTNLLISGRKFDDAQAQATLLLNQRPNDPAVHAMFAGLLAEEGEIQEAIGEMQKTIALSPGKWPPYLSLALLQWKDNQPAAAEASLKEVIALSPQTAQPRVLLGTYYESQGRLSDAEQQFQDAMTAEATNMDAREALARLYLTEGKQSDAENILLQANRDLPNDPESYMALSNFYFVTGNLGKAVDEYQALYEKWPKNVQVKKKYIELLIQAKRFGQARQLDNEILKTAPDDSDALLYRSEMQVSDGDLADGISTLQIVIKNAPNNSEAHYALGVAFKKQGNLVRAEGEWREALRLNPNSLSAERAIADSAMEQGNMRALQTAATQLIRMQPASPQGYALRALSNINLKQYDQAQADIQSAIQIAPQSAYGYVQLGNLKFVQGHYDDAVRAYQAALDRSADSMDAVRGLASAYISEKQVNKAVAAVILAIAASPANSDVYDLYGRILFHDKQDFNGAERALKKATVLNQHDLDAWMELCQVETSQGRVDEAIATGREALKANPNQIGPFLMLGNLYQTKSDWNSAESAYQNALAIDSQNAVASLQLARTMLHAGGNRDVALSLAQTARRELPNSPAPADTVGWIYYQEGLYSLALSSLQQALNLQQSGNFPDNPDLHYHLGMTYAKMKQAELARKQLEQVLKMNPTDSDAAQIIQELARLKS